MAAAEPIGWKPCGGSRSNQQRMECCAKQYGGMSLKLQSARVDTRNKIRSLLCPDNLAETWCLLLNLMEYFNADNLPLLFQFFVDSRRGEVSVMSADPIQTDAGLATSAIIGAG